MTDLVWSERRELHDPTGHVHDCVYSGGLMCLVHGGFRAFPLGMYTPEEREALERSDDRADETGASVIDVTVAVKRRYGLTLHVPETTDGPTELAKVGRAYGLSGLNGNLPAGHYLRRWDPDYIGGHFVTVIPLGAGKVRWLDPEATNKYGGDIVSIATVIQWSRKPFTARWVATNEYAASGGAAGGIDIVGLRTELAYPPIVGRLAIPTGIDSIRVSDGVHYKTTAATTRDAVTAALQGAQTESGYLVDLVGLGPEPEQHFIRGSAAVTFTPAPPAAGFTQAQLDAAKAAGETDGYTRAKAAAEAAVSAI